MKKLAAALILLSAGALSGCKTGESAPPPPGGISVQPRDSSVIVTWAPESGVDYWLLYAAAPGVSSQNVATLAGGKIIPHVVSPLTVKNLVNGTTYYFTANGRTDGGPGGSDSPVVSATPRLAGTTWTVGSPTGTGDLRGTAAGSTFVAVGAGGATYYSTDARSWTAAPFVVSTNLNAVVHNASPGLYVAVGDAGTVITSSDTQTWEVQTSGTSARLAAVASNAGGFFAAVGSNGTVLTSPGAGTWTTVTVGTSKNLNGIAYGLAQFVAVGAGGVILTTTDGLTWTASTSGTSQNLNAVAFGKASAGTPLFVAVGAAGTVLTSIDGTTWTASAPPTTRDLTAISFGTQFVAVGAGGTILTSTDGVTWTAASSGTTNALAAIAAGNLGYAAVGASGTNLTAY